MSQKTQKLELTWIGKGDEPKLEPRMLIENRQTHFNKQVLNKKKACFVGRLCNLSLSYIHAR